MKTLIALISLLVSTNCYALTIHSPLTETQHMSLDNIITPTMNTHHSELKFIEKPKVKVYLNTQKQLEEISKFAGCVPQIDFIASLNVPEWVTEYPTYEWIGDDTEDYYYAGDLETFTRKFVKRNPSFSQRVQFDYVEAMELGYPIRYNNWSVLGNYYPTKEQTIYHLTWHPNHSGRFDVDWMWTQTVESLLALHSDHHEGRVATSYINKEKKPAKIIVQEVSYEVKEEVPKVTKEKTIKVETPKKSVYRSTTTSRPQGTVLNIFAPKKKGRKTYRVRGGCPGGFCPTY